MPRCKSCHAEIKFIRTEKGRVMPVDIKPVTVITSFGKTISFGQTVLAQVNSENNPPMGCNAPSLHIGESYEMSRLR